METEKSPSQGEQSSQQGEEFEEFNPLRAEYNAAIVEAGLSVSEDAKDKWESEKDKLIDLTAEMMEWKEEHAGLSSSEITPEDAEAYRKLDDSRADIAIELMPEDDLGIDRLKKFYMVLETAARCKTKLDTEESSKN